VQSDSWVQPEPSVTARRIPELHSVNCTNAQLHVLASINPGTTKNAIVVALTQRASADAAEPHRH
jgi:hypothetical protein